MTSRGFAHLWRSYSFFDLIRLGVDWLFTRLVLPQARLIRRPSYIRGMLFMEIGAGLTTGPGMRLDAFPESTTLGKVLRIGCDVQLNDYVHIAAVESVMIGDRVLIASRVFISDHNHGSFKAGEVHDSPLVPPQQRALSCSPVVIEDDVWIGEGAAVLPGVRIGKGAVIGALAVVTRDVPEFCIAVGSPARVIKRYNFESRVWEKV